MFVSDFFYEQVKGGAESSDDVLISFLQSKGHSVQKIQSHLFKNSIRLAPADNKLFIVSNFCNLSTASKRQLMLNENYIIYEHDHKYLISRNPGNYKNFLAPKQSIINLDFYLAAKKVICQSNFHLGIISKNLGELSNLYNVSGNLWSERQLKKIAELSSVKKTESYAILQSNVSHKNTAGAIKYCEENNLPCSLIPPLEYDNFLNELSTKIGLVFLPKTPETLCRVAVEARMMNLKVITNNLLGAKYEPWFKQRGFPLIKLMSNKFEEVYDELQKSL